MRVLLYTLAIAFMMVSTIPTYSGKLLGERISREWVLPIFIVAVAFVAHLITYPYGTLTAATLAYLAFIPLSWKRFRHLESVNAEAHHRKGDADARGHAGTRPPSRSASRMRRAPPRDRRARGRDAARRSEALSGAERGGSA